MADMGPEAHPLAASLASARELGDFFSLPVRRDEDVGWTPARELFQGNDGRLAEMVSAYGQRAWDSTNRHVAASAFLVAYLSRVVFPVAGQYVLFQRAPNVSLDNLYFHWNGPAIDATGMGRLTFAALANDLATPHTDGTAVADYDALYAQLKIWLFEENLEPVIADLRRAAGASVKVSWNAVAAAFSQAFNRLYATSGRADEVVAAAETFLSDTDSPIYGQMTMEEFRHRDRWGFFSRRRGCCLWWRSPRANDYCSNCILLPRDQQDERFREMLAGLR